jgi:hypothetical protein
MIEAFIVTVIVSAGVITWLWASLEEVKTDRDNILIALREERRRNARII